MGVDPATYEVSVQPDPSLPVPTTPRARCSLQAQGLAGWVRREPGLLPSQAPLGTQEQLGLWLPKAFRGHRLGVHILVKSVLKTTAVF